jgi:hypothetical protein
MDEEYSSEKVALSIRIGSEVTVVANFVQTYSSINGKAHQARQGDCGGDCNTEQQRECEDQMVDRANIFGQGS